MKNIFLFILFVTAQAFSQSVLDEFKYIDVPQKYDFFKEVDKYQLNSLTRFLFNKHGFNVLPEPNNYPQDYKLDNCLALKTRLVNSSKMFSTKLVIELIDCNGKVIFKSKEGKSREKDYKTSYQAALRDAFESIQTLNYRYKPKEKVVEKRAKEVQPISEDKPEKHPGVMEINSIDKPVEPKSINHVLYAQPIAIGFQLVDTTPKVVYVLQKTSAEGVYLIQGKQGVVINKEGKWFIEFYDGDTLRTQTLNIKF